MHRAAIISIGTELTLGQTIDTNAAWLARQLAAIGIRVGRCQILADETADIVAEIRRAAGEFSIILITGGLGPTADDLTREALAEVAAAPLELHQPSLEQLLAFFATRHRPMPEANRVQAMIPRGGRALPNTCGTAPGIHINAANAAIFAMPGVPFEMKAMFERDVLPGIRAAGDGRVLRFRLVRTYGMPESELGAVIKDLMKRGNNPEVGTTADLGEIGIRINATAETPDAALTMLDETEAVLRARLGHHVYGRDDDTLASVVGAGLVQRAESIATAESCTGGMVSTLLTDVPGSSRYFMGGLIAYANEAKSNLLGVSTAIIEHHGAVSEPVARHMAASARERFRTTYALSLTGIAGPDGGTTEKPVGLLYLGLAKPTDVDVRTLNFGSDQPRNAIRIRAAKAALNLLRRELH